MEGVRCIQVLVAQLSGGRPQAVCIRAAVRSAFQLLPAISEPSTVPDTKSWVSRASASLSIGVKSAPCVAGVEEVSAEVLSCWRV